MYVGYYTDDHNRPDVVQYRDNFLLEMENYEKRMKNYADDCPCLKGSQCDKCVVPILLQGERIVVFITHDETTVYSNDGKKFIWVENGKSVLKPKGLGTSIMITGNVN